MTGVHDQGPSFSSALKMFQQMEKTEVEKQVPPKSTSVSGHGHNITKGAKVGIRIGSHRMKEIAGSGDNSALKPGPPKMGKGMNVQGDLRSSEEKIAREIKELSQALKEFGEPDEMADLLDKVTKLGSQLVASPTAITDEAKYDAKIAMSELQQALDGLSSGKRIAVVDGKLTVKNKGITPNTRKTIKLKGAWKIIEILTQAQAAGISVQKQISILKGDKDFNALKGFNALLDKNADLKDKFKGIVKAEEKLQAVKKTKVADAATVTDTDKPEGKRDVAGAIATAPMGDKQSAKTEKFQAQLKDVATILSEGAGKKRIVRDDHGKFALKDTPRIVGRTRALNDPKTVNAAEHMLKIFAEAANKGITEIDIGGGKKFSTKKLIGELSSNKFFQSVVKNNPQLKPLMLSAKNRTLRADTRAALAKEGVSKEQLGGRIGQLAKEVKKMKDNPKLKLHYNAEKKEFYTDTKGKSDGVGEAAKLYYQGAASGVKVINKLDMVIYIDRFLSNPEISGAIAKNSDAVELMQLAQIEKVVGEAIDQWGNIPEGMNTISKNWNGIMEALRGNHGDIEFMDPVTLQLYQESMDNDPFVFFFDPTKPPISLNDIMGKYKAKADSKVAYMKAVLDNPMHMAENGYTYQTLEGASKTKHGDIDAQKKGDMSSSATILVEKVNRPMGFTVNKIMQPTFKVAIRSMHAKLSDSIDGLADKVNAEKLEGFKTKIDAAENAGVKETKKDTMDFDALNSAFGALLEVQKEIRSLNAEALRADPKAAAVYFGVSDEDFKKGQEKLRTETETAKSLSRTTNDVLTQLIVSANTVSWGSNSILRKHENGKSLLLALHTGAAHHLSQLENLSAGQAKAYSSVLQTAQDLENTVNDITKIGLKDFYNDKFDSAKTGRPSKRSSEKWDYRIADDYKPKELSTKQRQHLNAARDKLKAIHKQSLENEKNIDPSLMSQASAVSVTQSALRALIEVEVLLGKRPY